MVKQTTLILSLFAIQTYAANPWQGSWGQLNEQSAGGTITLRQCTENQCDFTLRNTGTDGSYCSLAGRAEINEKEAWLIPSANYKGAFEPNSYGCKFKMRLQDKSLHAESLTKSCEAYCTKPTAFVADYKFISPSPFNDRTDCFTKNTPAWKAWCVGEIFMKKGQEFLNLQIAAETADPEASKKFDSLFPENAINACNSESDPKACLLKKYDEQEAAIVALKNSALKTDDKFEKYFTTAGDEAAADQLIKKIEGVYKEQFNNALVDGTGYRSENILEIVRVSKSSIYFKTHLDYYNGHTCDLFGLAKYSVLNKFTFKADTCRLLIDANSNTINLDDHGGTCKEYCGARGSLRKIDFPLKKKRRIKYLARLRNSEDYKNATKN